ncbi:antibiotic biosynthesis monooxygenase [Rothia halotolerans]|uniref:antibiotic biosynthesis monooxygenase n=1 Tax=Rothia halotolerans TaxID=405770 RepID=UPI0013E9BB6A|nr:antibiotic biosynthesis monooxygenase [Rothia halotolerans]
MTILTILTLRVPRDRSDDVVRYYRSARILEESGAASARLCVDAEDSGNVVVVAEWPDAAAYEAWQGAPEREEFSRGILGAAGGAVDAGGQVLQVLEE